MGALTELIVTYEGRDYPVDTAELRLREAREIRRHLKIPTGDDVRTVWANRFDARDEEAAAALVWMALSRNGSPLASIDAVGDFDLFDYFRLADPDGAAAALAELEGSGEDDDAVPTRSGG